MFTHDEMAALKNINYRGFDWENILELSRATLGRPITYEEACHILNQPLGQSIIGYDDDAVAAAEMAATLLDLPPTQTYMGHNATGSSPYFPKTYDRSSLGRWS